MKKENKQFSPRKLSQKELIPYFFILPVLFVLLAMVAYPLIYGIAVSFFDTDLARQWNFTGVNLDIQKCRILWENLIILC